MSSQTSVDNDKGAEPTPAVVAKKSVPVIIKQHHITKKQPAGKKVAKMTQTEGRDDPEKAKEAIGRLQERLLVQSHCLINSLRRIADFNSCLSNRKCRTSLLS